MIQIVEHGNIFAKGVGQGLSLGKLFISQPFHPSLAPVGVLLAVMGYAIGTYGAWLCGILMQVVSP